MDRYRIAAGTKVDLAKHEPSAHDLAKDKAEAAAAIEPLKARLCELQEMLYAGAKHRVLIVLQAMDTGGKDGVIRHVLRGLNPAGLRVISFKAPSEDELAHDYLWRVHQQAPKRREVVVFNRSHYEDVLIVRVHDLVPEEQWRRRYDHIAGFEQLLADEGTTIVKLFLHISEDEQKRRLEARLADPTKRWKFNVGDLEERKLWADYQAAYAEMIERTSTDSAPWYVVPANRKWYRDLVVARVLVDALEALKLSYPDPPGLDGIVIAD
jgi:PPK2 family polyphosphate:nucleotide phosphotransferase